MTTICFIIILGAVTATLYDDINILRAGACVVMLKTDPLLESLARLSAATCRTDWDIDGYTRIVTTEDIKFMPGRCGINSARDQFVQNDSNLIGCAVATCTANTTICYTDGGQQGCGFCEIIKPTESTFTAVTTPQPTSVVVITTPQPTSTKTTTPQPTSTNTTTLPRNDLCLRAKLKCAVSCGIGSDEIFPFLDSCSLDIEGKISTCISPPDCECSVDLADRAAGFGGICAPYVCPAVFGNVGTLRWCRSCGYNCGGFQKDCLGNNGFCDKVSACQRLDMCAGWRESNCPGGVCGGVGGAGGLAAVTDAMIVTNFTTADRSGDSVGYAVGLAIGLLCCVIGSVACFWAVKKSKATYIPPEDVRRPIDDNKDPIGEVKEIILSRSRVEFPEEVL